LVVEAQPIFAVLGKDNELLRTIKKGVAKHEKTNVNKPHKKR